MMIPRNSIIYLILLLCVTTIARAGSHLLNDTCQTVQMGKDINKKLAQVVCNVYGNKSFDPKSQHGSYLFNNSTQNWAGEIFACLCGCRLPGDLKNGDISPKKTSINRGIILHGETLNYSCNDGYEKNIDKKIVCSDGLLMTVPDYLEEKHVNISFRQKSLSDSFASGEVFRLWVNETANWSYPEIEVGKKQKVFESLTENEMVLQYYLYNGNSYKLGHINLTMKQGLECKKINGTPALNDQGELWHLSVCIVLGLFLPALTIAI